jgi:riboflavin kinase / FMN adenylyltransferase
MEIVAGHRALGRRLREPAVAIGNFDGVHLGHQRLFAEIRRLSTARGGESVAFTFQPHPARVLAPRFAPPLICTPECKLERIAATGAVDVCVVEPFDHALADRSPVEFVDEVLVRALAARDVCVGHDFTFGKGRAGDVRLLAELGRARGFGLTVIEPVTADGIVCSSTKVREFMIEGRIEGAALLLGRDPEVVGEVVRGAGRGRTIGVPTANVRSDTELLPAPGVYAGWARTADGACCNAAINIGSNPTFTGPASGALSVEAHLLDYRGKDLYGSRLVLGFRRRLRAEQRFPSVEALVAQIREDIAAAAEGGRAPADTPGDGGK